MSESSSIVSKIVWKALAELCREFNCGDECEEQAEGQLETPANSITVLEWNWGWWSGMMWWGMLSTSWGMWDIVEDGLAEPWFSRPREHPKSSSSLGDADDGDRLFARPFLWREALGSLIKIHSFPFAEHLEHGCSKLQLTLDSTQAWKSLVQDILVDTDEQAQTWHDFRLDLLAFLLDLECEDVSCRFLLRIRTCLHKSFCVALVNHFE